MVARVLNQGVDHHVRVPGYLDSCGGYGGSSDQVSTQHVVKVLFSGVILRRDNI